jgi:hypothetical protein
MGIRPGEIIGMIRELSAHAGITSSGGVAPLEPG